MGGWLLKSHVMSESGLANRGSRKILRARDPTGAAGRGDEVWLGRSGEHGGWGYIDKDR